MTVFEGGIRVPAVIKWPQHIPAGSVSEQMMSVMDVFPTLADASGVPMKNEKPLDGENFWPLKQQTKLHCRLKGDNLVEEVEITLQKLREMQ